ncbi:MAG: prepilin-type N-terminal cleavage/methylation domain-containing protein [Candidatus Omnitrophota bacterium]
MNIRSKHGFNLYELMVAVAILSLGLVVIYESFLTVANATTGLPYYLKTQFVMDEMIWEQETLLRENGYLFPENVEGSLTLNNKELRWVRGIKLLDSSQGLYSVSMIFDWTASGKSLRNSRTVYVRR